jgi:hypothetical protein
MALQLAATFAWSSTTVYTDPVTPADAICRVVRDAGIVAFEGAQEHATQGIAQGGGLAPVQGADHKDPSLGAIVGYLVFDPVDLVLQHGLGGREGVQARTGRSSAGREGPQGQAGWRRSDAPPLGSAAAVVGEGGDIADEGGDFRNRRLYLDAIDGHGGHRFTC